MTAIVATLALLFLALGLPARSARADEAWPRRRFVELVRPQSGDAVVLERANRITAELAAQGIEVLVRFCRPEADDASCEAPPPALSSVARIVVLPNWQEGVRIEAAALAEARFLGRLPDEPDEPGTLAIRIVEVVRALVLEAARAPPPAGEEEGAGEGERESGSHASAAPGAASSHAGVSQILDDELPPEPVLPASTWQPLSGTLGWGLLGHSGGLPFDGTALVALRWRTARGWGTRAVGLFTPQSRPLNGALTLRSEAQFTLEAERAFSSLAAALGLGLFRLSVGSRANDAATSLLWSTCLSARLSVHFSVMEHLRGELGFTVFILALPGELRSGGTWVTSTGRWGSVLWFGWEFGEFGEFGKFGKFGSSG